MSQVPLNPAGGSAAVVKVKLSDADVLRLARLARLARRRKTRSRSAVARELLRYALDHLEAGTGPPGGG